MNIRIRINNINLLNYKISVYTNKNELLLEQINCNYIVFNAPYCGLYKIKITNNEPINIYITKTNCHTMNLFLGQKRETKKTFILTDANYPNLKIEKGELILWNKR